MNYDTYQEAIKGHDEAVEILLENKWWESKPEAKDQSRYFYQRFKTATNCKCNSDKPGIQVGVQMFRYGCYWGYEINLTGEMQDETWLSQKILHTPDDIQDGLKLVPRLLATWEFANNFEKKTCTNPPTGG